MTTDFIHTVRDQIAKWRGAGMEPSDALRECERFCGRHNEEFRPEGPEIVAQVYGGKFYPRAGGAGMAFVRDEVTWADATPTDDAPEDVAPVDAK